MKLRTSLSWFKKHCNEVKRTKYREKNEGRLALESRVAKIEGILEEMKFLLNHVEDRMGRLEDRHQSNFKWTIGINLTMWVTIILAILLGG